MEKRFSRLDEIRGLTLVSMILYHFLWDLVYIAGIDIPWYGKMPGHIWQQSICCTFILLSGFCRPLGKLPFKRGLTVFLAGGLVTIATLLFAPENRVIFGVLTLLGSCMLLTIPLDRIFARVKRKWTLALCCMFCLLCFILFYSVNRGFMPPFALGGIQWELPAFLYSGWLSTYLGFPMQNFYSTDYFPLLPWFFLFLCGYFPGRMFRLSDAEHVPAFLRTTTVPFADFLGRHSLLIYLLHQPVLYVIALLLALFRKG